MLVLTRKLDETIRIGEDIVIRVTLIKNGKVKIGIEAPAGMRVMRGELLATEKPEPASCVFPTVSGAVTGGVLSDQYPHVA